MHEKIFIQYWYMGYLKRRLNSFLLLPISHVSNRESIIRRCLEKNQAVNLPNYRIKTSTKSGVCTTTIQYSFHTFHPTMSTMVTIPMLQYTHAFYFPGSEDSQQPMVTERLRIIFSSINMTILHIKSIINAPKHIHWERGNKLGVVV
jgi:hypothetical protein